MKSIVQYVVVFMVASTAAVLLVVLALTFAPSLFPSGEVAASQDSVSTPAKTPSALPALARQDSAPAPGKAVHPALEDSLRSLKDTVAVLRRTLEEYRANAAKEPLRAAALPSPAEADSLQVADSLQQAESRTLARIFGAMQAESAARIMGGLTDEDVRSILLAVKQRQAAKILAALEPDRAARIVR